VAGKDFSLRALILTGFWGPTQPPIQWVLGVLSLEVQQPGREADRSPSSSVEVKNAWMYTSTHPYVFMAWCLIKHRDNFTLPYLYLLYGPLIFLILGKSGDDEFLTSDTLG
jgi:hypothetical protein